MREIKFRAWDYHKFAMSNAIELGDDCAFFQSFDRVSLRADHLKLMQYTGLKDKNGKEIYESDLIVYSDISGSGRPRIFGPRVVRWFRDTCNFNVTSPGPDAELEVIGNIYESPELLEANNGNA